MRPLKRKKRPLTIGSEISLTPLIDVALTLLVIFMITAPVVRNSIKIDLPQGQAQEGGKEPQEIIVSIDSKQLMYCNNKEVTLENLGQEIKNCMSLFKDKENKRVWVMVDKSTCSAGTLINVIDCIKVVGGVKDVAIATEKPGTKTV